MSVKYDLIFKGFSESFCYHVGDMVFVMKSDRIKVKRKKGQGKPRMQKVRLSAPYKCVRDIEEIG